MSLDMARQACSDGITTVACTPHILPTVYENKGPDIKAAVALLQQALTTEGIPLRLLRGADVHLVPDLVAGLRDGRIITLAGSRYLLLEPPHHVMPPQLDDCIFKLQSAGYVAILTHPERLSWIEAQYPVIRRMVYKGVWMQLTAGSLTGRFGRRPRYWAERMLDDGLCHVLATDAHDTEKRPPRMAEARELIAERLGEAEATNIVLTRARGILENLSPAELPALPPARAPQRKSGPAAPSAWSNILKRVRRVAGTR